MILKGSQRGGASALARHLLNSAENDHVAVHTLRGFADDASLGGALNEAAAIAKGTKCQQFLFSLSVNPPQGETVPVAAFEAAIERAEQVLGLCGHPRAIVFHEKDGRRHAHAVWSRIDADSMTAVNLPFFKTKLNGLAKQLFLDHGWALPEGFREGGKPDPLAMSRAEWQQAKRTRQDAAQLKAMFAECWAASDDLGSFRAALLERGFHLARGDRRGVVALDFRGEAYAVSRWCGVKAKAVREKLGDAKALPSVEDAKAVIAAGVTRQLRSYIAEVESALADQRAAIGFRKHQLRDRQRAERERLKDSQAERWRRESQFRAGRFRTGVMGFWDRLTGKAHKIAEANAREARDAEQRDRHDRDALIAAQLKDRRALQDDLKALYDAAAKETAQLHRDVAEYGAHGAPSPDRDAPNMDAGRGNALRTKERSNEAEIG